MWDFSLLRFFLSSVAQTILVISVASDSILRVVLSQPRRLHSEEESVHLCNCLVRCARSLFGRISLRGFTLKSLRVVAAVYCHAVSRFGLRSALPDLSIFFQPPTSYHNTCCDRTSVPFLDSSGLLAADAAAVAALGSPSVANGSMLKKETEGIE